MDWIDWLVLWMVASVVAGVAWSMFRAGAQPDEAREQARDDRNLRAIQKRLEELGKVKAGKFGGLR